MRVVKKDGTHESFDPTKIINAVGKSAARVMKKFTKEDEYQIVNEVTKSLSDYDESDVPIAVMHSAVENALEQVDSAVAKSYRDYRNYKQDFVHLMDEVYQASQSIRFIGDKENANTDSALVATKRCLIFNELNKRLYRRFFMTKEELNACKDGYIYIHDQSARLDTFNCFSRDTKFVTHNGLKSFMDYADGDVVCVLSHKGAVKTAIVHCYGKQQVHTVIFTNSDDDVPITVTANHRWILHDGSETTDLKIGDVLIQSPLEHDSDTIPWSVKDILDDYTETDVWCLEVEGDHSFLLQWGIPTGNCCLFDAANVMRGGFEMGNIWYNEPKSLDTAFDVLGDIILATASQQYGGFTICEIDKILSPYAEKSYKKYMQEYDELMSESGSITIDGALRDKYAKRKVERDFEQGFQGIEMKLNTVGSSRGDYPFITMTFGLATDDFGKMASKIFLRVHRNGQGKSGNKKPVLFPKLVYLYDKQLNEPGCINEDVFEEAIECSSKTMYPDWLSLTGDGYVPEMYKKYGRVVAPMGCVLGDHLLNYKYDGETYCDTFEDFWDRIETPYNVYGQSYENDINRIIYTEELDISVYDTKLNDYTKVNAIIRNFSDSWCEVKVENAITLRVTTDHPFETENRGVIHAEDLQPTDIIRINERIYGHQFGHVESVTPIKLLANSYDLTTESEHFEVSGVYSHNCRAFLSPWYERGGMNPADEDDKPVFVGRFNIGVVSLHLPMILQKSRQENKGFYEVLDYYLEMIRNIHKRTYEYLGELHASVNPVAFCEGGLYGGNLKPTDKIKPILKPMTASFGITALNELQELYNGKSLVEDGDFALEVLKYINNKVAEFKEEDGYLYALYGTPAENLCFSGDTVVQTYGGNKSIKDLTTDDLVYSIDEATGKIELKKVLHSWKTRSNATVVEVKFDNGQTIVCTPDHPIAVRKKVKRDENGKFTSREYIEYVEASRLQPGDRIKSNYIRTNDHGRPECSMQGKRVEVFNENMEHIKTYDYIADAQKDGYTPHLIKLACEGHHNHLYRGVKWFYPSECESLLEANHKVVSVEYLDETMDVYDIEVEDNHNFFVGDNDGILVHNCGKQITQFRQKYGIIENVSDRPYVSNSFHCHVTENITPIEKQDLEGRFWNYMNGGKIQYVRYPVSYNKEAVKTLVRRAMDLGYYEGVNLSLAYCDDCGHQELEMDVCPVCGSKNLTKIDRMNGYLAFSRVHGDTRLNSAKMAEIAERKSM